MSGIVIRETARLRIARLTTDDAPFILGLVNDPDFLRYIGDRGVRSLEDAVAYITNGPLASYARHGFGLYLVADLSVAHGWFLQHGQKSVWAVVEADDAA